MIAALLCLVLQPQEEWKAGVAATGITPDRPVPLSGYASRDHSFEGVEHGLWAKALAIEDAAGHRAVIISTDVTGFRADVADPIAERIMAATGLARARILLNSSHTHSGPLLTLNPGARGHITDEEAGRAVAYTKHLQDQVVEVALAALGRLAPARLSWGAGVATFVMNRREPTTDGLRLGVNPRGFVDRSVPVLRVDGPEGNLRAVIFGAACHNTTLGPDNYRVCGDYAGFAQIHIEERHRGAQAMFMAGCGGDANPWPRGSMDLARLHGTALGTEVTRVLGAKLAPLHGPLRIEGDRVDLPLAPPPPREELERILKQPPTYAHQTARMLLRRIEAGEKLPASYPAPIAVWRFGEDLTMVALSGEVVADYVPLLERALGPLKLWMAAYCNDKFGYFPSKRVIAEGGYEAQGLADAGPGFFSPEAEDILVRTVVELAGRPAHPAKK